MNKPIKIQFLGTPQDEPYLYNLTSALGIYKSGAGANMRKFDFISEITATYAPKGVTHIVTTQEHLIPALFNTASSKEQTLNNYAGSWATCKDTGIHFLFVNPLKQCATIPYGKFLLDRFITKITHPHYWLDVTPFSWTQVTDANFHQALKSVQSAIACAVDIETRKDLSISSVAYTAIHITQGRPRTETYVIGLPYGLELVDYEVMFDIWIKQLNQTDTPKILQNGKYDCAYFQYYGVPLKSYLWDTQNMHHCWLAELPKALGILGNFYVKESIYWKYEGDTGNAYDLYNYNALDTHYTAWVFLQWIMEAPEWAKKNYLLEFPVIHPNFLMESTGLLVDMEAFKEVLEEHSDKKVSALMEVRANIGEPNFNPGSPPQTFKLMSILGCGDLKKADDKALNRAAYRHPFNHYIIELILKYRKAAKLVSTYLVETKIFNGRVLYSISPTTVTGRNASSAHAFWTGLNIQNIPRGGNIKRFMIADPGFMLYELDSAAAESRDTAYITGDATLIANVTNPDKDFHKLNASMFFNVPYEEVDKPLRQLSKPVNHGANYLMTEETLIDSMGLPKVFYAAMRLQLPKMWQAKKIANHLLKLFAVTYPVVANDYPTWIQQTAKSIGHFTNPYGYTRRTFLEPIKSREHLRQLVASLPQGTNGQALNRATVRIFYDVWKKHSDNFKMHAQIHDSNVITIREGHEYILDLVKQKSEEANIVDVTDIKGVTRTMVVPVDVTKGGRSWQDSKED
jgi:DNA polymerase I-like protein with 3'-5' exonuclease and polymerase domains